MPWPGLEPEGQGLYPSPPPCRASEPRRVRSPLCNAFPPLYLRVALQVEGVTVAHASVLALDGAGALEVLVPSSDPPA